MLYFGLMLLTFAAAMILMLFFKGNNPKYTRGVYAMYIYSYMVPQKNKICVKPLDIWLCH